MEAFMENVVIYLRVSPEEKEQFNVLCKVNVRSPKDQFRFMLQKAYEEVVKDHIEKSYRNNPALQELVVKAIIMAYQFNKENPLVVRKFDEQDCISIAAVAQIANNISEPNGHPDGLLTAHSVGQIACNELNLETSKRTESGFYIKYNKIRLEGLAVSFGIDPDALEPVAL
jgi:hypothetical protein